MTTPSHPAPRRAAFRRRTLLGAVLAAALLGWQAPSAAQSSEAAEERVKAAFLYKFPSYVDWPAAALPTAETPYRIGVIGDDAVAEELVRIAVGRSINNRQVQVRRLAAGGDARDLHLLFIGRGERARQAELLRQAAGQPMLTVTETDNGLVQGGMINFRIVDDRVRFEVAVDTAERAGLKLSARLLAVALSVVKGTP